jgi:molybdate transport system substrate-binding protein
VSLCAVAALAPGCGSSLKSGFPKEQVVVWAAESVKAPLPKFDPGSRYMFGHPDQLAKQIRTGGRPDVFVSDGSALPQQLARAGLAERPVSFAGDPLVVVTPIKGSKVHSLADLAKPGVKIAAGAPSTAIGQYTSQLLARLPATQAKAVRRNLKSSAPGPSAIVAKVADTGADAGIVYLSDAKGLRGKLKSIPVPAKLRPKVAFTAAVVKHGKHLSLARKYVVRLRLPTAQKVLRKSGFSPP